MKIAPKNYRYLLFFLLTGGSSLLSSCSKEADSLQVKIQEPELVSQIRKAELRVAFAKTFAKAMANKQVRLAVKTQAMKFFDKDYDVLLSQIKNNKITANRNLYSYIDSLHSITIQSGGDSRNTSGVINPVDLETITKNLPLLNIYVPTFLQGGWDVENQIPVVAVRDAENRLIAFNDQGEQEVLNPLEEPLAPIIVVKENERLVANGPRIRPNVQKYGDFLLKDGDTDYYFLDNEYNYQKSKAASRQVSTALVDAKMKEAFDIGNTCQTCAQRDWIYYNINTSNGQNNGSLNSNYEEAVTAIRFENVSGLNTIGGWDEGNLEFWLNGFFGGTTPTNLVPNFKNLSVSASDLFTYHTERRRPSFWRFWNYADVIVADGVKEYSFGVPVKFVPWDMKRYGDTWGLVIEEYDLTVSEKQTYHHSTTVGTNFSVNASTGTDTKIGGTFGGSTSTVKESTVEYQSQTGNDRLGAVTVSFASPIVTRWQGSELVWMQPNTAWTNELTSGTVILSFESVRVR